MDIGDLGEGLTQLEEVIQVLKIHLCTEFVKIILQYLEKQGIRDDELLDGIGGHFIECELDEIADYCASAAKSLRKLREKDEGTDSAQ
jgi:hypothetical protein